MFGLFRVSLGLQARGTRDLGARFNSLRFGA